MIKLKLFVYSVLKIWILQTYYNNSVSTNYWKNTFFMLRLKIKDKKGVNSKQK